MDISKASKIAEGYCLAVDLQTKLLERFFKEDKNTRLKLVPDLDTHPINGAAFNIFGCAGLFDSETRLARINIRRNIEYDRCSVHVIAFHEQVEQALCSLYKEHDYDVDSICISGEHVKGRANTLYLKGDDRF